MKRSLITLCILFIFQLAVAQEADIPAAIDEHPDTVRVGAYIISVHDINFHEKEYTVRFWLWFLYSNLSFDFTTQLDIPNAKAIDKPEIILDGIEGKQWVIMKMKCTMKENWDVEDFPFDRQHLKVKIENTLFDNKSLVFLPDTADSRFDEKEGIDGWKLTDFRVTRDINDYKTGFGDYRKGHDQFEFSQFQINMEIERNAWGLFLKIFIGMYIAFLIAIISFTPKPSELEPRFGLPVGGLFAAVGNKYIIDSLLPESSSFTLVDTLHTVTFFSIFITLLVSAVALKYHESNKKELSERVSRIGSRVVIIGYVVLNIIFITLALL